VVYHCCPCEAGRSIGCSDDLDDDSSCAQKDGRESDQHDTGELDVLSADVSSESEDRIPTAFYGALPTWNLLVILR